MELRIQGEQAVLVGRTGTRERQVDPRTLPLEPGLTEALREWARVASAVRRAGTDPGEPAAGTRPGSAGDADEDAAAGAVVSQRGRQLAARLAATMGVAVSYADPVTGAVSLIAPPAPAAPHGPGQAVPVPGVVRRFGRMFQAERYAPEPTPWATGLVVAAFVGVVVLVAIVALTSALAGETSGWLAIGAALVVTAGLAPSLWLGRRLPILRWVVLGAAAGLALSWIPVLVLAF
ncbi:hypothetical protein CFN78_24520 [Amycolatopsis antarctica]|uniref:DUF2537 domain-containing protein n=1 Tax=Amycolatopsis antarctica TaxID=1854586 RepID=A0A263CWV2_9PSEU|nr:DUF2537 domain-containing protein [Amycolatopsis antarctica]OZM70571.1 hypothetical protein CFN78_24520 [Amycolatopsis antarctica]